MTERKLILNPPAELQARPGDVPLPPGVFLGLSLFARLRKKPNLERFPGTLILRRYQRGEVICRQGEAGWTAFYSLTSDDLLALRQELVAAAPKHERPTLEAELSRLQEMKASSAAQSRRQTESFQTSTHPDATALPFQSVSAAPETPDPEGSPSALACWVTSKVNPLPYTSRIDAGPCDGEAQSTGAPTTESIPVEAEHLTQAVTIHDREDQTADPRPIADIYLVLGPRSKEAEEGLLARLFRLRGRTANPTRRKVPHIRISNTREVTPDTPEKLYEGELFGEMSCLWGSHRSATIVARDDCYVLEMLRNILDEVLEDEGYRAHVDALYRKQVLQDHLRQLPLFDGLTEEQLAYLRDGAELVRYKVGQVIFDEYDRSDGMFLVRNGVVKVVTGVSSLVRVDDVADWSVLCARLKQGERETGALAAVWAALPEPTRRALRDARGDETRGEIVRGLNEVIKHPPVPEPKSRSGFGKLPADPALTWHVQGLAKDPRHWSDLDRRRYGRLLVEAVLPGALRSEGRLPRLESVLSYLSAGEIFGEIGLTTGLPRSASCMAYGHPEPGQGHQKPGPTARWREHEPLVELVRIPEPLFRRLIEESPAVHARVEAAAEGWKKRAAELHAAPAWEDRRGVQFTERFQELGLVQGQQLMLIDLDRCTRCDECVRACIDTHEDGRSRLLLDGPRFGKYLVPTTCRSCRDPVCMIGCPVGSIHRGDNRQMVIENWCIGCGLCAANCPYGSIQMHDVGLVPEGAHGWRYYPATAVADPHWMRPKYRDHHWLLGKAPFRHDLDLRAALEDVRPGRGVIDPADPSLCFRYEFRLRSENVRSDGEFRLETTSSDRRLTVWLNGREVTHTTTAPSRGKREYRVAKDGTMLRAGRNVIAVRATPPHDLEILLDLRLDDVRRPVAPPGVEGEVSEKLVTERAVVCDMCSSQFGQRPACVNACPHDAAWRIDARTGLPPR
jgi:Fe-S-cluster-containing hydrogenase component 2/CRP-like cAMP-binding protein